jgi:hypothetical protein
MNTGEFHPALFEMQQIQRVAVQPVASNPVEYWICSTVSHSQKMATSVDVQDVPGFSIL